MWSLNATTGAVLWKYELNAVVGSSPALAEDGALYVGTEGGYLLKFVTKGL